MAIGRGRGDERASPSRQGDVGGKTCRGLCALRPRTDSGGGARFVGGSRDRSTRAQGGPDGRFTSGPKGKAKAAPAGEISGSEDPPKRKKKKEAEGVTVWGWAYPEDYAIPKKH